MKRASSLNFLNAGGKATEDHFQVRSLPYLCPGRQALSWSAADHPRPFPPPRAYVQCLQYIMVKASNAPIDGSSEL